MTLLEFLDNDILGRRAAEHQIRDGMSRFSSYLPNDTSSVWPRLLSRFVRLAPWRYWDPDLVNDCLSILEHSVERTKAAISRRSLSLGLGIDNLFRRSPLTDYEEALDHNNARDLIRVATEFHPEYLRYAEHVFGNLLEVYWAVLKKGPVEGHYDLRGATTLIGKKGHNKPLEGYVEYIRNAIAHGEVAFTAFDIRYGRDYPKIMSSGDFFSEYDKLYRTANGLAIGIILFLARNPSILVGNDSLKLPVSLIAMIASAGIERPGLEVIGAVESDSIHGERQLHVSVKSFFKSRERVMSDTTRLCAYLIRNGASAYSRYLIQIDHGKVVQSLLVISPGKLQELLRENAPISRIGEIFADTQLLWYDENWLCRMFKTYKYLFLSQFDLHSFKGYKDRFRIRKMKNISSAGVARIHVWAVLYYPEDAKDKELLRNIARTIIIRVSRKWINSNIGFEKNIWWPAHPKIVGVYLYKLDGSIRWLERGGWPAKNLIALAEMVKGRRNPILVPDPEEVWNGIRFRFQMDMAKFEKLPKEISNLLPK